MSHLEETTTGASRVWRPALHLPELVDLAPGRFHMGEQPHDKFATNTERPSHPVEIRHAFALGGFPVTVAEFARFDGRAYADAEANLPVAGVSWIEAQAYCEWAGAECGWHLRLPSEAEWEYACRAGTEEPFPSGWVLTSTDANFWYNESGGKVGPGRRTPVGAYPANRFGLYDMNGNVCEWVQDEWHNSLENAPIDGRAWQTSTEPAARVLRGGAWDYLPRLLRNCWRDFLEPVVRRDNVGFRVAITLPHS
ncbi:MAG: formylglycine-generating enzyme family protein [Chthoniobacteraceae bacterium]